MEKTRGTFKGTWCRANAVAMKVVHLCKRLKGLWSKDCSFEGVSSQYVVDFNGSSNAKILLEEYLKYFD